MIPLEVAWEVAIMFASIEDACAGRLGKVDPSRIMHFEKRDVSRGEAWDRVAETIAGDINPWRKCHTRNYWVWVKEE